MHRTDAVLWKKQDIESRQAADTQSASTSQAPVHMEDPSTTALPEISPAAKFQLPEDVESHTSDVFEPPVSSFVEVFAFSPFADNDPTPEQNRDELLFHSNDLGQQFDLTDMFTTEENHDSQDLVSPADDNFRPHVSAYVEDYAFPPFSDSDQATKQNIDQAVFNSNELNQQFDMLTMGNMSQGLVSPSGDNFDPHVSAYLGDFAFPLDGVWTAEQNLAQFVFNFTELDQHFDLPEMPTMDDNVQVAQVLVRPTEDDRQYLNNNFDEL
ncbi:hypothetical protein BD410DRAFT_897331 [Rickenella mellea]|uniref:Uncharacterized protein n=1 Tax=Rickenella mellea TaxID=50990 RepID=A0A4Y7Q8P5_9AGAM|nr:hypothetical protein BD410DRAFT_897331 [Rickenella mellea]